MSKISTLPPLDPASITGEETVVAVKDGTTGRSTMMHLAAPALAQAAASALEAADAAHAMADQVIAPFVLDGFGLPASPGCYFWGPSFSSLDRHITSISADVVSAGSFIVEIAQQTGSGTWIVVSESVITLPAGANSTLDDLAIPLPANCMVGIFPGSGQMRYQPGDIPDGITQYYRETPPDAASPLAALTVNGMKWHPTITAEVPFKARRAFDSIDAVANVVGQSVRIGWPEPISDVGSVAGNYTVIDTQPLTQGQRVTGVRIGSPAIGSVRILLVTMADGEISNLQGWDTPVEAGVNNIPLNITADAGQMIGVYGSLTFQNSVNPTGRAVWYKSGSPPAIGNVLAQGAVHRFEVAFTVKSGLVADVDAALASSDDGTGLSLLGAADQDGLLDATEIFALARAAHPAPYVRPGTFAVTSLSAHGSRLWGPGSVLVADQPHFIPAQPSSRSLWHALRAEMMEDIAAGNVLTLIGDSISHFAFAPSGAEHWFNMFTRWVNQSISMDEPGMTALRPYQTYDPAFYGITTTGPVSTGNDGPLGECLVLELGSSINFSGAFAHVGAHFTRGPGGGTLTFAANGAAPYMTVNTAGAAEMDAFSGLGATGQAATANHVLTATGGPVKITNLIRLGQIAPVTATNHRRLLTQRTAHGGYTFGDFITPARTASLIKQGQWAGGRIAPIIALGVNDSRTTAPGEIVANATVLLDALATAGCDVIRAIPPMRPSATWDAQYAANRTFDEASAALRKLYRVRGVNIIPMDALGWSEDGLSEDGLHPFGLAAQRKQAQIAIEHLAKW